MKKELHLEEKAVKFENLRELFKYSANEYGDEIAFVTKVKDKQTKEVTYKNTTFVDLYDEINALGTSIMNKPFAGSKIALIGENSYAWCLSYFAISTGNNVIVPLDKLLQLDEVESCIIRSDSQAIFCDKKHYKIIKEIVNRGNTKIQAVIGLDFKPEDGYSLEEMLEDGENLLNDGNKIYLDYKLDREDLHFLLFTSGTTSMSKAVMLSHKNITSTIYDMACEEAFYSGDTSLTILPLHHIYGLSAMLLFIASGVKNTFCDGLKYIVPNFKEYKITLFVGVPLLLENMYKKINKAIEKNGLQGKINFAKKTANIGEKIGLNLRKRLFQKINDQLGGHLRFIISGAAPIDPEVLKGFNDFGILTVQGYGLTETSPTIASESYRHLRAGSVGKLMPGVEGKIIDKDADGIGELIVKGDNVMLGYYQNEEATNEVLVDGWFHTGDYGYFDEDGYLFLCGRKKNVIVMKNGKNVYPEEMENIMNSLPYVEETMVFTQDKSTDVVLWAKVVYSEEYLKEENLTLEELEEIFEKDLAKINASLPSYKMIKNHYLSNVPTIKTSTKKTKRKNEMEVILKELEELKIKKASN